MEGNLDSPPLHAVLRGGNWNEGANSGVFAANLNNGPTNSNNNVGFRCAVSPPSDSEATVPKIGTMFRFTN